MKRSDRTRVSKSRGRFSKAVCDALEDRRLFSSIAVYFDPAYVNTTSTGDGTYLLQQIQTISGNSVATFAGTDVGSFNTALTSANLLVIPALDNGDLGGALASDAITAIQNFVTNGGGLLVVGNPSDNDTNFLADVFGYGTIADYTGNTTAFALDATGDVGTDFTVGPATISAANTVDSAGDKPYAVTSASLPAGSVNIYDDAARGGGGGGPGGGGASQAVAVALLPEQTGGVTQPVGYLGYNWYNGGPNGTQDGGWNQVLELAIDQLTGTTVPVTITATAPASQTATAGTTSNFSLGSFTETFATAPYTVDVNWGDGSTDSTINMNAAGTIPTTAHDYTTAGSYTPSVTVTDSNADTSNTATFGVTVGNPPGETLTAPASQTTTAGVTTDFLLGSFTQTSTTGPYAVTVAWGDGSTSTFNVSSAGTLPSTAHTYALAGVDVATVTVVDSTGAYTDSTTFDVTISPGTITVTPPAAVSVDAGVSTAFGLGTLADVGAAGPYKVTVNWGDGTADTVFSQAAAGTITAQYHTYPMAGTDTATVTASNSNGQITGSGSFVVTALTGTAASSVALQASTGSIQYGQTVTLTATVSPPTATGVVTFEQSGVIVGTATVGSGGKASLATTALAVGAGAIVAVYSGNQTYAGSTSTAIGVVVSPPPAATAVTLQVSSGEINTSQSLTLIATVSPNVSNGQTATGVVTFYEAGAVIGTGALAGDGVATFTTGTALALGTDTMGASYGGDANFQASAETTFNVTVDPTVTRTVLSASTQSKTESQTAILTATIEPYTAETNTLSAFNPGGTVTFYDAGVEIGSAGVGSNDVASLPVTTQLPAGINAVTATYTGDTAFGNSSSAGTFVQVTEHALVPVATKVTVPSTVPAGFAPAGSVAAVLNNQLTNTEAGDENGYFSVRVYASATGTLNTATDPLVGLVVRKARVGQGKSVKVSVPFMAFPTSLAGGAYQLLVESTDPYGNTEIVNTGRTVNVVPAQISLSAAFVSVPKNVLTTGAILSLTTAGNTSDLSTFTAEIGLSTDAAGQDVVARGAAVMPVSAILVRVGHTTRLRITGFGSLYDSVAAGPYYLTITFTDSTGHTATAVSAKLVG